MADDEIRYSLDDQPSVESLSALRQAVGWDPSTSDLPAAYRAYSTSVSAYLEGERLVGWAAVVSDRVRHGFFVDVIVHPRHQRQGIGRELVSRAIERGRSQGLSLFHADFAAENVAFYRACGFTIGAGGFVEVAKRESS